MKKYILLSVVFGLLISGLAYAGGNELAYKRVTELPTLTNTSIVTGDFVPVYDASAGKTRKVIADILATTATAAELNLAADLSASYEDVIATNVLTTAECGKIITLNAATEFATTLPTPLAGCKFKFIVKAAPVGAAYTIATNGDDNILIGGINELEVDTANDGPYSAVGDLISFVASLAAVGDYVEMVSDGTSWYLTGQTNLDGGVTIGST